MQTIFNDFFLQEILEVVFVRGRDVLLAYVGHRWDKIGVFLISDEIIFVFLVVEEGGVLW